MLENIFISILNMSLVSSFVIVAVILVRLLLKKVPKIFSYALWSVVLFRLICPFSFESILSLIPVNPKPIASDIIYSQAPRINTGLSRLDSTISAVLPPATPYSSINPMQVIMAIALFVWLVGIAAMLIYSIITLIKLKSQLKSAVYEGDNIYISENIKTPFVIGCIRPKIYIPINLSEAEKQYIILHEKTHIKRLDHIVKIASFLVLCLHWFNPLVWVSFFLSGKDMEMSCDESVIKKLGHDIKREYSTSLLSLATGKRIINATPLAFGEGDTKGRIKNVLNYKKPAFWVIIVAVIAVAVAIVCFSGNKTSAGNKVDLSDIETMSMGSEMPFLLYCKNDVAIMHGTFGYLVYDLSAQEPISRLSYEQMNKNDILFPWGDVSEDGKGIYLYDEMLSSQKEPPYTHYYDIEKGTLERVSKEHSGMPYIPRPASENDGKYKEFFGDYHTGATLVENDKSFFYLRSKSFNIKDLELVEQSYDDSKTNVWLIFPEKVQFEALRDNFSKLYAYKTEFIGDNVKVSNICTNLPVPQTLVSKGIALSTDQEPYGLTLNYTASENLDDMTFVNYNAAILFSLIKNLDVVIFNIHFDNLGVTGFDNQFSVRRDFLEKDVVKKDLWESAATVEDFTISMNSFMQEYTMYWSLNSDAFSTDSISIADYNNEFAKNIVVDKYGIEFTIPKNIPNGFKPFVDVAVTLPAGDGTNMTIHPFEEGNWKPGNTYSKEYDGLADGTQVSFLIMLAYENGEVFSTVETSYEYKNNETTSYSPSFDETMSKAVSKLESLQKEFQQKIEEAKKNQATESLDEAAQKAAEAKYLEEKAKNQAEIDKIEEEVRKAIAAAGQSGTSANGEKRLTMAGDYKNVIVNAENAGIEIRPSENDRIELQYSEEIFNVGTTVIGQDLKVTVNNKVKQNTLDKRVVIYIPEKTVQSIKLAADQTAATLMGLNTNINVSGADNAISLTIPQNFSKTINCISNDSSIAIAIDEKADNYTLKLSVKDCAVKMGSQFPAYKNDMEEYEYKKGNGNATIRLGLSDCAVSVN